MLRNTFLASVVVLFAASCSTSTPAPAAAQQGFRTGYVELYRFNGQFVGNVSGDGKPVVAWVRGQEAGYTEDKLPILGVTYSGSADKDGISITVAALANAGNATKAEELKEVSVGTYHLGPGQSTWIEDLKKFGMPPMLLRGVVAAAQQ